MQFLITAIAVVISLVGVVSSCPRGCFCTDTSEGVKVDCFSIGLNSFPTDLPDNTYNLRLQYNNISVIEDNTFNNLPSLQYLLLQYNEISVIDNNTFNNLPNLQYLYLYSNKITSIKSDTFNHLTSLLDLRLQNNNIAVIEDNAFFNLPSLKYLSLQYNDISVIEDNTFNNLPSLQYLFMKHNPILLVSENAFDNLKQLIFIKFGMYCSSCRNIPFWRWLKINQELSSSITCYDNGGKKLYNLQPNKYTDCFIVPTSDDDDDSLMFLAGVFLVTYIVFVLVTLRKMAKKIQQRRQRELDSLIYTGVRNTERHIVDNIMVDLEQFNADYDIGDIGDIVDSSAEELEQPTGEYDIGDIVDSSAEELEQPNAEYEIGDIVDSHTVEMEQFAQYDITPHIGK